MDKNGVPLKLNTISHLVSHSNPLFCCIITLYLLILLYFPHISFRIIIYPILIIAGIFLLSLHRRRAIRSSETESVEINEAKEIGENKVIERNDAETKDCSNQEPKWTACEFGSKPDFKPNLGFEENFVEWNVRAPLDVIYEEHEEDFDDEGFIQLNNSDLTYNEPSKVVGIDRYPSLLLYYPESDSDSSSEWDYSANVNWVSPENTCFGSEDDDRDGLIEISLDRESKERDLDFHGEEDNLIEINLSSLTNSRCSFLKSS